MVSVETNGIAKKGQLGEISVRPRRCGPDGWLYAECVGVFGGAGSLRRWRAAATAETEERQALAIAPSPWSGRRLTSNSISAARRSLARTSIGLSSGAELSAACAARSRRQLRQKRPSSQRSQVSGSSTRLPSIWLIETPHWSQLHFFEVGFAVAVLMRPPLPYCDGVAAVASGRRRSCRCRCHLSWCWCSSAESRPRRSRFRRSRRDGRARTRG